MRVNFGILSVHPGLEGVLGGYKGCRRRRCNERKSDGAAQGGNRGAAIFCHVGASCWRVDGRFSDDRSLRRWTGACDQQCGRNFKNVNRGVNVDISLNDADIKVAHAMGIDPKAVA